MGGPGGDAGIGVGEGCSHGGVIEVCWTAGREGGSWGGRGVGRRGFGRWAGGDGKGWSCEKGNSRW